jgi:hypothetical protein
MSKKTEMIACVEELLGRLRFCGGSINDDFPQTMASINRLIAACYALRGEQPCENCQKSQDSRNEAIRLMNKFCIDGIDLAERCAEWERAYDETINIVRHNIFPSAYIVTLIKAHDPRRKSGQEPKEQPCENCQQLREQSDKHFEAFMELQIKRAKAEDKCAEWEKAYQGVYNCLMRNPGWETAQDIMNTHDPRSKQAEEPTPLRDDGEWRM